MIRARKSEVLDLDVIDGLSEFSPEWFLADFVD